MVDEVQEALRDWVERADRARGAAAVEAIADEWRPRIWRLLPHPSREQVEDALHDALVALCLAEGGEPPRVLAPPDAANPAAWRRRVLSNFLIDQHRRRSRRHHAEQAARHGWSPAAEKEAWRDEKRDAQPSLHVVATPVAPAARPDDVEQLDLAAERGRLLSVVPELVIRRRVLILLALGADLTPFLPELAAELGEEVEAVAERVAVAERTPHDATHDYLSTAMVRVVYPDPSLSKAREAARKAFARAVEDLRGKLREVS